MGRPRRELSFIWNRHKGRKEWLATTYVGGKRRRKFLGTTDKREAERRLKEAKRLAAEQQRLRESPALSTLIERFQAERAPYWAEKTRIYYAESLKVFNEYLEGRGITLLEELRNADIRDLTAYLSKRYASPASVNSRLRAVKAFLRYYDLDVHAKRLQPMKEPTRKLRVLDRNEIKALLDAAEGDLRDKILTLLLTGLRRDEMLRLSWGQVDLERRNIRIRGKGGKERILWLSDRMMELLKSRNNGQSKLVFPEGESKQEGWKFYREFMEAVERAGIAHCSPHDLRRTAASWLQEQGAGEHLIQSVLGHSTFDVTWRHYIELSEGQRRDAMMKLDELPGEH